MSNEIKLYIKVVDGLPVNHPAFELNLIDAFGAVPPEWEPFVRVPNPTFTDNTLVLTYPTPIYRKVDGVWRDEWQTRSKTQEELAAEKEAVLVPIREMWMNRPFASNFAAWVFNETTFMFEPPIPRPTEAAPPGFTYRWSGPDNNWKLAPLPPSNNGKHYYFDFDNWVNVEATVNV